MVDWNEDGLLDLLVGSDNSSEGIWLFLNSGTATDFQFTDYTKIEADGSPIGWQRCQIQIVDLNYDGKKDLVAGNRDYNLGANNGGFMFYENTGTNASPVLAKGVYLQTTDNKTLKGYINVICCFSDWNKDGGLDLIWTEYYPRGNVHLYLGEVPSVIADQSNFHPCTNPLKNIVTNGLLSINLNLKKEQRIIIHLYTADGTLIEAIEKGTVIAGNSKIKMNIGEHPAGVYFVQYKVANVNERQRIVLVK